jgi:hypothetical protein
MTASRVIFLAALALLGSSVDAQYGRGGGGGRRGGVGGGGGLAERAAAAGYQQQQQANAVARPGGDQAMEDSVRLFIQLDQDGVLLSAHPNVLRHLVREIEHPSLSYFCTSTLDPTDASKEKESFRKQITDPWHEIPPPAHIPMP